MVLLGTFAAFLSEFLTAGLLVICTCLTRSSQVNSTALGVNGMSAGLIHLLLANCFGQISGAHGNPAVSLALYLRGSMKLRRFIIFAIGQIIGATVGHYTVNTLLGKSPTDPVCIFQPKDDVEDLKIFGMSFLMTFILIMAWCSLWDYENLPIEAYLVIVNTMISLMGGFFSGAMANPARTLAPVFFNGFGQKTHLYIAGELAAAVVAPYLHLYLRKFIKC